MVPNSSRQVLIWSLPTLAFLLSLLWYRRKRRASLRSDPGGTASTSENHHPTSEELVCDSVTIVHSGVTLRINKPRNTSSAVTEESKSERSGIQNCEVVLEEGVCPTGSSYREIQASESSSKVVLDENRHPIEATSEPLLKDTVNAGGEPVVEEKIQPIAALCACTASPVVCNDLQNDNTVSDAGKEIDCSQEEIIADCIVEADLVNSEDIIKTDSEITIRETSIGDLLCPELSTTSVNDNSSKVQVIEKSDNTHIDTSPTEHRTEQKHNITEKVAEASLLNGASVQGSLNLKELQEIQGDIRKELGDNSGEIEVQFFPHTVNVKDTSSFIKAHDTELITSDLKTTSKTEDTEEVEDNESLSSVDSLSVATIVMARKSSTETSTLEKQAHEEDSNKKLTTQQANDSVSLECKLSTLELNGDASRESSSVDSSSTNGGAAASSQHHGTERDSANHSPADVMLASPSISSYSDAQSEGSSDSGKGCSDVATPPSRTPASGSSLSGDAPLPSVYEFVLPQHLVGRLIGRHGCFVHQIKAKTNASILIKRHPDTQKLKICAVEGTQADIESALEMIRQKFPTKRYPNVTLEQVSFLPPVPTFPLIPECLQLQLVEGVNNDVILSSLVSPAHFFLQQPTHPTFPALNRLNACMNMCYSEPAAPLLPMPTQAGVICVAPTMGGWYRAQVVAAEAESDVCDIKFVDYGGYLTIENTALRQIRSDFMTLPFQAAECYLANVASKAGDEETPWSKESVAAMEELTQGQVLQAQVCGYAEDGLPVVYLYAIHGSQVVLVNQELVSRGLAEWVEQPEA